MRPVHSSLPRVAPVAVALVLLTAAGPTRRAACTGEYCGTLVFAATGEPTTLLPPATDESLSRDIYDQIFLKLADVGLAQSTVGDQGFEPLLARRWEWTTPTTLVFHLDPRARWQDGQRVTAADVAFSFEAYTDSILNSPYRASLSRIASVSARDSLTTVFRFRERYPEMFYDAVFQIRVLPAHLLRSVPRDQWGSAAFGRSPVGNGPYRLVSWKPGESLELAADSTFFLGRPHLRRLIWRFSPDLTVAVTQVVAGEADAIQVLGSPENIDRARQAGHLALYPYASGVYTFLGFNLRANGDSSQPHPVLSDPGVRRAIVLATDRSRMVTSVFGGRAKVPPAPIPQLWSWLWLPELSVPPFDTAQAAALLARGGWRDTDGDGIRDRAGRPLSFHISTPSTSTFRKQYARLVQEQLRSVGIQVVIDEMDNATQQERLRAGQYDAALESWVADPSPASGIPQLWQSGGVSNHGRYANPVFDRQVDQAVKATTPVAARRAWAAAFQTLAQDAPAVMLYALDNTAAVDRRVTNVRIRPDSWWALVRTWRIPPDRLNERDRQER